jgi:O-antigen ligase
VSLSRGSLYLVIVGIAVLALAAGGGLLFVAVTESPLIVMATVGGILVGAAAYFSPRFSFYALLASAMFSRFEFGVPPGVSLRLDQIVLLPVLVGVAPHFVAELLAALSRPDRRFRVPALSALVFSGFALYISINLLSSYFFSPQFWESFKIVVWLVLSFVAFVVTYFLVGRYVSPREAFFAVLASGFISGAVGVALFLLFRFTGSTFGVQPPDVATNPIFKTYGTFLEANLFGSFQAFAVVGAIAMLYTGKIKGPMMLLLALGTTVSMLALALSLTRAAWLGALAGLLIFIFFQLGRGRSLSLLSAMVVLISGFVLAMTGLLGSVTARFQDTAVNQSSGTLAFRLERFRLALAEWPASPLFGLGTNSFGQRHWDPSQNYDPDYLPNLVLVTLYDSGLLGFLALFAVFAVLVGALIKIVLRGKNSWRSAVALAVLCGLATLFVSYQTTSGLWYSYNWIILAIAVRLCLPGGRTRRGTD